MATAVVFAFAVADGLPPVVGAAPYDVLARQLPRTLVTRLNGGGDRGVRFFPFLGHVGGQRTFLRLGELLDPAALVQLHKQGEARLLCDGMLRSGLLHFRVVDAIDQRVLADHELPFDPCRPLDALARLEFDLMGLLGWPGRPQPAPELDGEALGWFLVLKDALLRREANLHDPAPDPLRPARRCVELASHDADVVDLVLAFAAHLLRRGELRDEIAGLLAALAAAVPGPVALLERLSALALAAGAEQVAASTALRAAEQAPERNDLVERAAALLFRLERYDELQAIVGLARQRGVVSDAAIAQLAAVCDRTGDLARRRQLMDELLQRADLPVPVARLVVSFLLEEGRAEPARTVAARALILEPRHAMLQFEYARACLLLDATDAAARALQVAIEIGVSPEIGQQARRLLRLASVPGLWVGTQAVEKLLAAGDLQAALVAARTLVHRVGPVAEAWFLLGLVRHRLGQERRAERVLRRALRADELCADAHNRLGILLLTRGALPSGHSHLQRAHALAPHDASTLLHLAQACALLGQTADAERHVTRAERLGAESSLVAAVRRAIVTPPQG
jgi:tetratricopeptide (TPR) repeat protein